MERKIYWAVRTHGRYRRWEREVRAENGTCWKCGATDWLVIERDLQEELRPLYAASLTDQETCGYDLLLVLDRLSWSLARAICVGCMGSRAGALCGQVAELRKKAALRRSRQIRQWTRTGKKPAKVKRPRPPLQAPACGPARLWSGDDPSMWARARPRPLPDTE
jgi:hypothetical protein